jgi:hypothetical protein
MRSPRCLVTASFGPRHYAAPDFVARLLAAGGRRQPCALCRGGEKAALGALQAGLGRLEASRAALIPIRKSPAWWELPPDERRAIFEDKSRHIAAV